MAKRTPHIATSHLGRVRTTSYSVRAHAYAVSMSTLRLPKHMRGSWNYHRPVVWLAVRMLSVMELHWPNIQWCNSSVFVHLFIPLWVLFIHPEEENGGGDNTYCLRQSQPHLITPHLPHYNAKVTLAEAGECRLRTCLDNVATALP